MWYIGDIGIGASLVKKKKVYNNSNIKYYDYKSNRYVIEVREMIINITLFLHFEIDKDISHARNFIRSVYGIRERWYRPTL